MVHSELFTERSLTICIGFECNNHCKICMLDGLRENLKPVSYEFFKKLLDTAVGKYDRIILSGSEVTLIDNLEKYILAVKEKGFKKIQLQTNARKFSSKEFTKRIILAGANEFFISVLGPDAKTHDTLTQVNGSFDEMYSGLKNLSEFNVDIFTNTVINRLNYEKLPEIVEMISGLKNIAAVHMWYYWPMSGADDKNLLVDALSVLPFLKSGISIAEKNKLGFEIKKFPACLLGRHSVLVRNDLSKTLIDNRYWKSFSDNNWTCIFKKECKFKDTGCDGLSGAYIRKFGDCKEYLNK